MHGIFFPRLRAGKLCEAWLGDPGQVHGFRRRKTAEFFCVS